jgi:hypothetical protein
MIKKEVVQNERIHFFLNGLAINIRPFIGHKCVSERRSEGRGRERAKTMTRSDLLPSPKISGYISKRICVKTMCSENSSNCRFVLP